MVPNPHEILKLALRDAEGADGLGPIARAAMQAWEADTVDWLVDQPDALEWLYSHDHGDMVGRMRMAKGAGLAGQAMRTQAPVWVLDALEDHEEDAKLPFSAERPYRASLALPLEGDQSASVLVLRFLQPLVQQDEAAERWREALESFWMGFTTARRHQIEPDPEGVLTEVSETLLGSQYPEEILQHLVQFTARRFSYKVVTVRLLDEKTQSLVLRATQSGNRAYRRKAALPFGTSIAGQAMREKRTVTVLDVQEDETYVGHDLAEEQGLRSMVCVPLTVFERTIGVMSCYTAERRQFTTEEVRALEALARQAAVSIEHARLQVRTTLMQEMHHRVKNNLQQVASLLRLQMNQSQDHHVDEALGDSLGRILAIASVHDLLSRDDLDHVGLRSLAENLIQHTSQSILRGSGIRFQVQGDDTSLSTSQATQVALILNELILNAVEHGFGMDQSGDIHVTVEVDETQVDVWVSNNGSQLPENFTEQELGLGLQIVNSLARALRGTFTMKNELGWTVAHLSFTRTSGE